MAIRLTLCDANVTQQYIQRVAYRVALPTLLLSACIRLLGLHLCYNRLHFYYRVMHYNAKRDLAIACHLSVRL